jgi:hypothetical protein
MSHRCDRLGSLLPRWASEYGINLIILFFLDQVARVGQWTTRLPYLKIRTSRYADMACLAAWSPFWAFWGDMSHRCDMLFL